MAEAIYNEDGSVTYRGKTFRVGDRVKICRDTQHWHAECEWKGEEVFIKEVDSIDNTLCVLCPDDDTWCISLESLFEYSEEDEQHQAQPERKPWDMPELKPRMRVVNHNGTYVIAEVNGVLVGLRKRGWSEMTYLRLTATAVYDPPRTRTGTVAEGQALTPECTGELLWIKAEADKQRQAYEAKEARRQEIQAEIDELKAELEAIS